MGLIIRAVVSVLLAAVLSRFVTGLLLDEPTPWDLCFILSGVGTLIAVYGEHRSGNLDRRHR